MFVNTMCINSIMRIFDGLPFSLISGIAGHYYEAPFCGIMCTDIRFFLQQMWTSKHIENVATKASKPGNSGLAVLGV